MHVTEYSMVKLALDHGHHVPPQGHTFETAQLHVCEGVASTTIACSLFCVFPDISSVLLGQYIVIFNQVIVCVNDSNKSKFDSGGNQEEIEFW
jgi:hypothetical protein